MNDDPYTLRRGQAGADRLRILGAAMADSTERFLQRSGLTPGMRCLDAGCGVGVVSRRLAEITGHCHGIDLDSQFLEIARSGSLPPGLSLSQADVFQLAAEPLYDVVYSRYLLSHLEDPGLAIERLADVLKPGGLLLLEDVDFPGHVHHPPCPAFLRYLELYQKVVRKNGGNPCLGRTLYSLVLDCDLESVEMELVVSLQYRDPGKRVAELTLEHVASPLLNGGLVEAVELEELLRDLRAFRQDEKSFMSIAPTYQVKARKPEISGKR